MKLSVVIALSSAVLSQAWAPVSNIPFRQASSLNAASIWYSTSTGNTETIAGYVAEAAGLSANDIGDATADEITGADALI
eukprot:9561706-Ditylum_brightwellii.AAC.1